MSYLSIEDLESFDCESEVPIITCGTGRGKTSLVTSRKLIEHFEGVTSQKVRFALLLVPTKSLKGQILGDNRETTTPLRNSDFAELDGDERIRVACFAQLAKFITDGNEIANQPDLVILDEIDLLVSWSLCFEGYINAFDYLFSKREEMMLCGLTATPSLLLDYLNDNLSFRFKDITPRIPPRYKAKEIEVVAHSSASTYLKQLTLGEGEKALCYVRAARECKRLSDALGDDAAFIISQSNELSEQQMVNASAFGEKGIELRDYLVNVGTYPNSLRTLIINDAMSCGFSIKDEAVNTVVCDTCDLSIAIQVMGRIRHDIDRFVLVYNLKERDSYFKSLERARRFFAVEEASQDYLKGRFDERGESGDILVYKHGDVYKANPLARGIYEYTFDIYKKHLASSASAKKYYSSLGQYCERLSFVEGKNIAANARNIEKIKALDLRALFGISNEIDSRWITTKELSAIAKSLELKKACGGTYGKEKLIEYINSLGNWAIVPRGKKQIKGVRTNWYEIRTVSKTDG